MSETDWVRLMAAGVGRMLERRNSRLEVKTGLKLAYGHEITRYQSAEAVVRTSRFETDMSIVEVAKDGSWLPRVVIEAKLASVTTHDAITYSQKAEAHRTVHPYLRYGIMLGNRGTFPLPGRLIRHGAHFDFMVSFKQRRPSEAELLAFVRLLRAEVKASRTLEGLLFESRKKGRERFTVLQRKLEVR